MSTLYKVLLIWLTINGAYPIVMLSRHRRPYLLRRMFEWVVGTPRPARLRFARALVIAAHHRH
jgi:hypothetical protein